MSTTKRKTKWYFTGARVLSFYACTVVVLILSSSVTKSISPKIADQASMFLSVIFTFFLVLNFARWEKVSLAEIGIIPSGKSPARFVTGYTVGLLMACTQALIVLGFGHFKLIQADQITAGEIGLQLLLYFLVACREELVFRSYFLKSLNDALTPLPALLIVTSIFIIEHVAGGMSWQMAILGSGPGGILFGLAALKTKGLALPLGLHSAWNFGQWSLGFKNRPGIWEAITDKGYEAKVQNIGIFAFLIVFALAITGICVFYRKEKLR